jgi:hypothetical chaperone protein
MHCGFDFGTSNCALGVMTDRQDVRLLPIEGDQAFMPSTLYTSDRDLIADFVARQIVDKETQNHFLNVRRNALNRAQRTRHEEGLGNQDQTVFFGKAAIQENLSLPAEGYFMKSPKSFLGASGLSPNMIDFFEDIVTAMMIEVKQRSQGKLEHELTQAVIGRPVNFQGLDADKSNQQALAILTAAAKRAGFNQVEFQYEPIGAALNFEYGLKEDQTVLVVDVGGGTSDFALVRMGPSHLDKLERQQDFIGHTGERIGGNDFDIQLSARQFMPLFGMLSRLKSGLPMPTQPFWDAVRTNDVGAQAAFHEKSLGQRLKQLLRDSEQPELLQRFIDMRDNQQNHHVVRSAESAKIALSTDTAVAVDLSYIDGQLGLSVSREQLKNAVERLSQRVVYLASETIKQSATQPDMVFITGGSGQSPIIREALAKALGNIPLLDGDHFGSVAAGLTRWAARIF